MPVVPVDLTPGKRKRVTLCNYGPSRSGKTELAATFPRPLFLSDKMESGWETIRYMDKAKFYEPEHKTPSGGPCEVWPIAKAEEMLESIPAVQQILQKEPNRWATIVIDSFTFYADSYFASLELLNRKAAGAKYDPRRTFQDLGSHLRWVMIRVHEITEPLGINVVWLALEKPPGESGDPGGILLSGQSALKTPGRRRDRLRGLSPTVRCHAGRRARLSSTAVSHGVADVPRLRAAARDRASVRYREEGEGSVADFQSTRWAPAHFNPTWAEPTESEVR
jgi:hypothetical protein